MSEDIKKETNFSIPFLPLPRPMHSPDHPSGMATPPLQTLASVPFKWEEQPGKPRPCTDIMAIPEPDKLLELELPPCRNMIKLTRMPSPGDVFDGPYNVGRPKFYSFRLLKGSFDSSSCDSHEGSDVDGFLTGSRKFEGQKRNKVWFLGRVWKLKGGKKGSIGISHSFDERCLVHEGGKMRRSGSFSGFRSSTNHLSWAAVYQSLKQVIPWKTTGKSKKDGSNMKERDE